MIENRFFESGKTYRLCTFEVRENEEWAPPTGTSVLHSEPIIDEDSGAMDGFYIWALVPSSTMHRVMGDSHADV